MWLGLCIGLGCGEIAIHVSQDSDHQPTLRDFLGVHSPQPYVKPWLRLFRRLSALPALLPLRSAEAPCWSCGKVDLVMGIPLSGMARLADASLCLLCGAVTVRRMREGGGSTILHGIDWATPDQAVALLRQAIAALESARSTDGLSQ
jgi:hypothetical protein